MKTVFLCGFMGCGKSTVGKALADRLGCGFCDMDTYITEKENMEIPQIFAEKGEKYFRERETEAIRELAETGGVVACGGGAMLKKENAEIAAEKGNAVYIEAPFDLCYSRIEGDVNRPIVMDNTREELEHIYESRVPIYRENSGITVSGDGTVKEIADRIAREIQ